MRWLSGRGAISLWKTPRLRSRSSARRDATSVAVHQGRGLLAWFVKALAEASLLVGLGGIGALSAEGPVGVGDGQVQRVPFEGAGGGTTAGAGAWVGGWGAEFDDQPAGGARSERVTAVSARS